MNITESFTYIFKSKSWYIPIIIGSLIDLPVIIVTYLMKGANSNPFAGNYLLICAVYIIVTTVFNILITGYYLTNTNRRVIKPDSNILSWTNFTEILKTGIKAFGAAFIYGIPLGIILITTFVIYLYTAFDISNPAPSPLYPIATKVCALITLCLNILIIPAFVTNLKFSSFFNFKLIFNLIKKNFSGFIVMTIISILYLIVYSYLSKLLPVNPYIMIPVVSLISFYLMMVKSDVIAQFVRDAANN